MKEKIKIKQLLQSQRMIENHNQTLDIVNNSLSINNLIIVKKIKELHGQIE